MSPADPPIVAPSGRRAYGWLRGQELEQRVHFVLAGVVLVLFGRENIDALGRHVCFPRTGSSAIAQELAERSSG